MNWSDERYVKLYVRDTLTWLSWSWETRAVFALLLRKMDGAGVIETGRMDAAQAVAMQITVPTDVVRRALTEMLDSGTLVSVANGLLLPNYVSAQEATKTERLKKADQRQRIADQRRFAEVVDSTATLVPPRPALSPSVPLQPSPAQPSPAHHQPSGDDRGDRRDKPKATKKPKAQAELPAIVPPPPPREPSRGEHLFELWEITRETHLEELGVGPLPDASYQPAFVNKVFRTWFDLWADAPTHPRAAEAGLINGAEWRCVALFEAYLALDWPAKCVARVDGKDTETPQPYPFSALASEKVWKPLVAQLWPPDEATAGAA